MNFLNDITAYEITHASVVKFETNQKPTMKDRNWHGIAFSLGGELYYVHNGKNIYLKENDIVYLPKGATYNIRCTKSGSFAVINFNVTEDNLCNEFVGIKTNRLNVIKREFSRIHDIVITNEQYKRCDLLSAFYKILSLIVADTQEAVMPTPLTAAMAFIDKNVDNPLLSNTQIANHAGISEVYLRKLFSNNLNISAKQYIQNKRTDKAKLLLSETNISITDIAAECGYSCIYYFCRALNRILDIHPQNTEKTIK